MVYPTKSRLILEKRQIRVVEIIFQYFLILMPKPFSSFDSTKYSCFFTPFTQSINIKVITLKLFYRILLFQTTFSTRKNHFLVRHTFLCKNYNSQYWYAFSKYLKLCSFSGHGCF